MNLDKLINNFIVSYLKRGTYASYMEVFESLIDIKNLITNNPSKTPEEIIDIMIKDNINELENIRKLYPVPGYTSFINLDNINIKIFGGNINYLGEKMPSNAMFDIASMTKFYTEVVAYNLIKEGYFCYDSIVKDLDSRFVNLNNTTIGDILSFNVSFMTNGRIDDKESIYDAIDTLYNTKMISKSVYNYNDIGMMILKEVMEKETNLSFDKLIDKYILHPLNLSNTHLIVPKCKFSLLTGSPNTKYGKVNDLKAIAVGGYSGHAGIFASSFDIAKFMKSAYNENILPQNSDMYTKSKYSDIRGVMGNTFVSHPLGLEKTFIDKIEPKDSFNVQGSTRVNGTASFDSAHNILFNPSSMSKEDALELNEKINFERKEKGLEPISLVKSFTFDSDGKLSNYTLIDPRQLFAISNVESVIKRNAKTILNLRFLNEYVKVYDKNYNMNINIEKDVNKRR